MDLSKLAEAYLVHNGAFGKMHQEGGSVGHGDHPIPDLIGDNQIIVICTIYWPLVATL